MVEYSDDRDALDATIEEMLSVTDAVIPEGALYNIRDLQSCGEEEYAIDFIKDYDPDIREKLSPESQKVFDYAIKFANR